ncbi:MAG TPA: transposase [Streptosporangiaceae bacterium]|nr:transposase [Streptosporangiaceae bacterium]
MIGIDLGEDKQAIAVADHDVRVLARKTVRVPAFRLGEALDWAVAQARVKGFRHVAVACEPTGPRWMQVQRLCAERGLPLVCIQPLVSHIAREQQDYTPHKADEADCVLIARLACELHWSESRTSAGRAAAAGGGAVGFWAGGLAGGCFEFSGGGVDGLDGDLVTEAFQAAEVVAGLAADAGAALVVVGAEVGVGGFGVR